MLLGLMRKHAKSWLIKIFMAIIVIVFVFYFGYSFRSGSSSTVAYVNGDPISAKEYQRAEFALREELYQQFKSIWNDNFIKIFDIKRRAMDTLIIQRLILQEAERIGLGLGKDDVQRIIVDNSMFKNNNGEFDINRYRSTLAANYMEPAEFENLSGKRLLETKLNQVLFSLAPVSEDETLSYYTFENERIKLNYVMFDPSEYREGITAEDDSLKSFFESHSKQYNVPEKISVSYIKLSPEMFTDHVTVEDKDIVDYYGYNRESWNKPENVKASHILFSIPDGADEDTEQKIKSEAEEVLKKLKADKDNFSEYAKEFSSCPSKEQGGDLGYFTRGQMVKEFEDAAFSLGAGEISNLVRSSFGFHIIMVEEHNHATEKSMEDVKSEIIASITEIKTQELAKDRGISLIDQMPYNVNLKEYADEQNEKIYETDLFGTDDAFPIAGADSRITQSLFAMKPGDTSELVTIQDSHYIFQVEKRIDAYTPDLEEIKDRVKEDYVNQEALSLVRKEAEAFLSELKKKELTWEEAVSKYKLEDRVTDFFTRKGNVPEIPMDQNFKDSVFKLNEDNIYPDKVYETPGSVVVLRFNDKQGIDEEEYNKDKNMYGNHVSQLKKQQILQGMVSSLREKAKIEILVPMD